MGRPLKPPRLYLRKLKNGPVWVVLDRGREVSTGTSDSREAIDYLRFYIAREYLKERKLPRSVMGCIYVIGIEDDPAGPVKIGFSANLEKRLIALQTGIHRRLVVLGSYPAKRSEEAELHKQLAHLSAGGEWFHRGPEIESVIRHGMTHWHPRPFFSIQREIRRKHKEEKLTDTMTAAPSQGAR